MYACVVYACVVYACMLFIYTSRTYTHRDDHNNGHRVLLVVVVKSMITVMMTHVW